KKSDNNTGNATIGNLKLIPLTQMRYKDIDINREVSFQYIVYFAIAGLLVIFCSLLNYLILFISRFRIRQKELALRVVCGASGSSLFLLLSVEFLLTLLFAFGLGLACVRLVLPTFRKLAEIHSDTITVYGQLSGYVLGIILISFLIFLLILLVFRKRTLNVSIRKGRSNLFRYASIVLQLIISIGFIFCTSVLLKQIYYLHHTADIGFSYKNIANVGVYPVDKKVLANQLKKIPEITDVLLLPKGADAPLFPIGGRTATHVLEWDDQPSKKEPVVLSLRHHFSGHIIEFYGIQLLKGEWLDENDSINVLIDEAAVKAFGWSEPIGKSFGMNDKRAGYKVKGVIKNIYNLLPTMPPNPYCYSQKGYADHGVGGGGIPIKYQEGTWKTTKAKIENLLEKEYKNATWKNITQAEEAYDDLFKSEAALLKLLSFVSLICIVICLFGFVSIVSLTCEERRKEIAIRKINGATIRDILLIFFREFTALLALGALVAFTFGYYIMKKWLEQYNLQTAIPLWLYAAILLALALIIIFFVGWRVYKTSNENPAEVVKRE
ncbi:MAG: ABC transporter permease, partial [Candidatus Azobacteroides sp.]|nr:ABC transporter permease [Candidatus Azobacteroides sp.]